MDFQSASPSVVRSVKQLDLLNTWLRQFARQQGLPRLEHFQPERIADEAPEMMSFQVVGDGDTARFLITHEGGRLTTAYGNEHIDPHERTNRYLDDAIGPERYARVVELYRACLKARRPAYSVSMVRDADGKNVCYERLLMPFGSATAIEHIVGSYKAISIEGGFQVKDLMKMGMGPQPEIILRAIIDRDVARTGSNHHIADDLEFN